MLFDIFSRIFLAITSLSPSQKLPDNGPNGSIITTPDNLSLAILLDTWLNNDTIIKENPNLEYENGEISELENNWMITLPLCHSFIDSDGYYIKDHTNGTIMDMDQLGYYWYPAPHLFPSENRSHFMFQVYKPSCNTPLKTLKLLMDDFDVVGHQGRFLRNGYFGFNNQEFYSPQEYCINKLNQEYAQLLLCESQESECSTNPLENSNGRRPCIQKCCDPDEIYSFARRSCIKSSTGSLFHPTFYRHLSSKLSSSEQQVTLPHYHIKFPRTFKYQCVENRTQILGPHPTGLLLARL